MLVEYLIHPPGPGAGGVGRRSDQVALPGQADGFGDSHLARVLGPADVDAAWNPRAVNAARAAGYCRSGPGGLLYSARD